MEVKVSKKLEGILENQFAPKKRVSAYDARKNEYARLKEDYDKLKIKYENTEKTAEIVHVRLIDLEDRVIRQNKEIVRILAEKAELAKNSSIVDLHNLRSELAKAEARYVKAENEATFWENDVREKEKALVQISKELKDDDMKYNEIQRVTIKMHDHYESRMNVLYKIIDKLLKKEKKK